MEQIQKMPFTEIEKADTQLTIYAATKKANESMAHSYSHLWKIPNTMFRFFTVYGPWGRPDMALFKFVKRYLIISQLIFIIKVTCIEISLMLMI